jgi:nucleoside-diphosphate kinase
MTLASANFHTGRDYGGMCLQFNLTFPLEEAPTFGRGSSLSITNFLTDVREFLYVSTYIASFLGGCASMKEKTLSIIKPDGVARRVLGEVIRRIEEAGLDIVAMKMIEMTLAEAKGFYKVHEGKPFFESLIDFMSSGPCVVMVLEGDNAITRYRQLMGATDYTKAEEGTIRRAFATDIEKNVVHGSDSESSADFEISYFFSELEIVSG